MGLFKIPPRSSMPSHSFVTLPARIEGVFGGLLFAAGQTESGLFPDATINNYNGGLSFLIPTYMKSATSPDKVDIEIEVMSIVDGEAKDVEVADFDAVNEISGGTVVAGTAKHPTFVTIPCPNDGSPVGPEVSFIFRINRDHDDADDTASGDLVIGTTPMLVSYLNS